jgi:hypothetical protein
MWPNLNMCCLFVYCLFLKVKVFSRRLYRNHGLRKAEFTHTCLLDFLSFQGGELHALLGDAELRG